MNKKGAVEETEEKEIEITRDMFTSGIEEAIRTTERQMIRLYQQNTKLKNVLEGFKKDKRKYDVKCFTDGINIYYKKYGFKKIGF